MNNFTKKQTIGSFINDCQTLAYRNLLKTKHNPEKLFDVTIQPIIMMVMFSFLFGGAISGSIEEYLPIVVPGIIATSLLQASASSGIQLREDINTGVFDRFNSLPIYRISTLAGLLSSDIVRYVIAAVLGIGTGYVLGWDPAGGITYVIIATILVIFVAFALSWLFASLGLIFKSSQTITGVAMLVMMLLTFISNAYIPIDTLPHFLQVIANLNPITHVIDAFKSLAYEQVFDIDVVLSIVSSIVIMVIFIPVTIGLFKKTLD